MQAQDERPVATVNDGNEERHDEGDDLGPERENGEPGVDQVTFEHDETRVGESAQERAQCQHDTTRFPIRASVRKGATDTMIPADTMPRSADSVHAVS